MSNAPQPDEWTKGYNHGWNHGRRYIAFMLDTAWNKEYQNGYRDGYRAGRGDYTTIFEQPKESTELGGNA